MDKPITIIIKESEDKLNELIEESGLPAVIWKYILDRYSLILDQMAVQQYKQDNYKYSDSMTKDINIEE